MLQPSQTYAIQCTLYSKEAHFYIFKSFELPRILLLKCCRCNVSRWRPVCWLIILQDLRHSRRRIHPLAAKILRKLLVIIKRPRTKQSYKVIPCQNFLGKELLCHKPNILLLLREQILALLVSLIHNSSNLGVNILGRFLREWLRQLLLVIFIKAEVSNLPTHSEACDHGPRQLGHLFEIIARSARHGVEM